MADNKYRYPPAPPNGGDLFSKNIVGLQITDGGGLTQGNFEFSDGVSEKKNREFDIGNFSEPISLSDLKITDIEEAKQIAAKNFNVYPNYDLTKVTTFTMYGSLQKRLGSSITKIINNFPAGLVSDFIYYDYSTGFTAYDIVYDKVNDTTDLKINASRLKNPFDIDYSVNSGRNLQVNPSELSEIRDLTNNYLRYSLYLGENFNTEYGLVDLDPTELLNYGELNISVSGNPFNNKTLTTEKIIIKPNNLETEKIFDETFDKVEKFLLNRFSVPRYTAKFEVIELDISGNYFKTNKRVTWPLDGTWNLDIRTENYENYIIQVNRIAESLDEFKTNLISRFLTTGAFKDFDTDDQKMEKILQLYGRSFDEIKKFIDALGHINSVNYIVKDDIPSQLLKNLASTLGWNTDISPIANEKFIDSIFNTKEGSDYSGLSKDPTPAELNFQYYRNLILNSAYLFKSKGTHRSLEYILRFIGAPKALIEFNEVIYMADGKINMDLFNGEIDTFAGGSRMVTDTVLDPNNIFTFEGNQYTGFTTQSVIVNVDTTREDYPVDELGYPKAPTQTETYFFQQGAGWFEQTAEHRSLEVLDVTGSVFTGSNANVQTYLEPFTYGQKYLSRYRQFPYMDIGFEIFRVYDNRKSWADHETGLRQSKTSGINAYYQTPDDRLIMNAKNIEVYLNMGQGLVYDVWDMSRKTNYPIPSTGLTTPLQDNTGTDRTVINPNPKEKTFFEFAQTFYRNMINVRNRQRSGPTYPSLQRLYWLYLNSDETVNIPSNKYTYQKMIDFTDGLGSNWTKLLEQMVPATTLWIAGQKFENSVFDRTRIVWRKQRGCEIIPVACIPCRLTGQIFRYDCVKKVAECNVSVDSMSLLFNQVLQNTITNNGYTQEQCDLNSIVSNWHIIISLGQNVISENQFYVGNGLNEYPDNYTWENSLMEELGSLLPYGLIYEKVGDVINIQNAGCDVLFEDESVSIDIKIDIQLNCDGVIYGLLSYIDGEPLWDSRESAEEYAKTNNLTGYRSQEFNGKTGYIAGYKSNPKTKIIRKVSNPFTSINQ